MINCLLKIRLVAILGLVLSSFNISSQGNVEYQRIYLSGADSGSPVGWDFKVSDGRKANEWTKIPVPANWELHGFGTYNYGHDHRDQEVAKEHGFYRHEFFVPDAWKANVIRLVFEGVMTDATVKINGKLAGETHQGAFYSFSYDISKIIKYGVKNVLEVDVAKHSANESVNKAEREADYWIFGGIFRPVYLEVVPKAHFKQIAIDAGHSGEFNAQIVLSRNISGGHLNLTLQTLDGESVGDPRSFPIPKGQTQFMVNTVYDAVKSWNPEKPALYQAVFELENKGEILYRKKERFGFRTVELRANDGFYVNDRKVVFKGVNRHSFWPSTGRALSEENHLQDIFLMKAMNMNAVRMAHYSPDERFLELCDSLGLFVLDELAGWQNGYDTITGAKLVKELVLDDANHPSVVIWDNGNEGGWEFATEKWFNHYDIQKRPVIYPWLKRNGVDTRHYPDYNFAINRLPYGYEPFMPTEFLHGLYDGGHGAGLDDFWKNYSAHPMFSGGFLWSFSDEAIVRTDKKGILDSDGNHAPDGILGPYREKEGSFYTIKDVWSPIQIAPRSVREDFDGRLSIENSYIYSNLDQHIFEWKVFSVPTFDSEKKIASGSLTGFELAPKEKRTLQLEVSGKLTGGDIFELVARHPDGSVVNTWRWPIKLPQERSIVTTLVNTETSSISVEEESESITVKVGERIFGFDPSTGGITRVVVEGQAFSLSNGPMTVGQESRVKDVRWKTTKTGEFELNIIRNEYPEQVKWRISNQGILSIEVSGLNMHKDSIDMIGISFDYPEEKVERVKWLGKGPYRVWKNRERGALIGVWQKEYNNTITGVSFDKLIYPEFKGYHAELYWAELFTEEGTIRLISGTPGLYFGLFRPEAPPTSPGGVVPPSPEGDLSFLYEIPAIGTKFKKAYETGPSGRPGQTVARAGDANDPIKIWFDFQIGEK